MELALLGAAAVVLIVAAALFARRLGIALPLLLVLVGAGLSFIPGMPDLEFDPEWILVVVLPPLLYSAAVNVPLVDFRRNLTPILGLGVVAVFVSAFATGTILYLLLPDLDYAGAVALGAVIGPTDAVAATSVAKRLGLPHRLVTILEGESLINDASALVLLRTAIAAVGGALSFGSMVGQFAWAAVGGAVVGLVLGWVSVLLRSRFRDDLLATALSFVVPFVAYIGAEEIQASGVIAVVAAGLLIGHQSARRFSARTRLAERINWRTVQFVLENGIFLLMGYQLYGYGTGVIEDGYELWVPIGLALLLTVVLIVARAAFVAPLLAWLRLGERNAVARGEQMEQRVNAVRVHVGKVAAATDHPEVHRRLRRFELFARRRTADLDFIRNEGLGWRGGVVITWAGMRGVVTVAAAQTIPASVPYRPELILIALVVAVVTLLLGGLTLPPVIRGLRLRGPDGADLADERAELLGEIGVISEESLRNPTLTDDDGRPFPTELLDRVRKELAVLGKAAAQRSAARQDAGQAQLQRLRERILEVQQSALLDARSSGAYSSATINEVQALLDSVELRSPGGEGTP